MEVRWFKAVGSSLLTTVTVLGLLGGAQAQDASAPPRYLNGGAGEQERAQLEAQRDAYTLQLVFSTDGGAYAVADAVTVSNRGGVLLTVRDAGPLLLLALPPGPYVVKATFNGIAQERAVSVSGAGTLKVPWRAPVQ